MNAKRIITIISSLYLIGSTLLWQLSDKANINKMGKSIVLITYAVMALVMIVLKITNGNGYNFKRPAFINPIDRAKIYNRATPIVLVLIAIGIALSLIAFKNQNYMYDFIALVIVLIVAWNATIIMGDRIEQIKNHK